MDERVEAFRKRQEGAVPVIICDQCGKGFMNLFNGVDPFPEWWLIRSDGLQQAVCGGALIQITRRSAIEIADRYEKIGREQWLRGKRKP